MPQPVVTEADLRDRIRRPVHGQRVEVPADARLSPAAQDFVQAWGLELVRVPAAPGAASSVTAGAREAPHTGERRPHWDRPGEFPVVLSGDPPRCEVCDQPVTRKPSHLTQLDAERFAAKTNPRVRLRGKVDTVHALTMLAAARARDRGRNELAAELDTFAAYCREIQSAEYQGREAAPLALAGRDETDAHAATHDPDAALGIGHVVPDESDDEVLHWLNLLRCEAREAELAGLDAYPPSQADAVAHSVTHALNRLSSGAYLLVLLVRAGELDGGMR